MRESRDIQAYNDYLNSAAFKELDDMASHDPYRSLMDRIDNLIPSAPENPATGQETAPTGFLQTVPDHGLTPQ
jgi:hypothetical protein